MTLRIALIWHCLSAGVQVTGVRSSVNVEAEYEEYITHTHVTLQTPQSFCDTAGDPPPHFAELVATMTGDPNFLYNVVTNGLLGYTELMIELNKKPPNTVKGYQALSARLWQCVLSFVDEDEQNSIYMQNAKKEWDAGWAKAPAIDQKIDDFQQSGNATVLAEAVSEVASASLTVAANSICAENMTKVFTGMDFLITGICDAAVEYSIGNTTQAMQTFWDGLNNTVYAVTTEDQRENAPWASFYNQTERRAAELFAFIAEWQAAVISSDICYRASLARQLKPASVCPNGYTWDQISLCTPDIYHGINCSNACPEAVATGGGPCQTFCQGSGTGVRYCCKRGFGSDQVCGAAQYVSLDGHQHTDASNYFQCVDPVIFGLAQTGSKSMEESMLQRAVVQGKRVSVDRSASGKCFFGFCWGESATVPVKTDPYGARNASCNPLSQFPDPTGDGYCSQQCTDGWIVNPDNKADCLGTCPSEKSFAGKLGFTFGSVGSSWPVCAVSENHLLVRNADMGMLAINTMSAIQNAVIDVLSTGAITETKMDGLVDAMQNIALNFAVPQCTQQGS